MYVFSTALEAIDKSDGKLKVFAGPYIEALTWADAERICIELYPYLTVVGRLEAEGKYEEVDGEIKIDSDDEINYLPFSKN